MTGSLTDALGLAVGALAVVAPFAFVVAILWIQQAARNRQFNQLIEERKLLIEKGRDLPELRLPGDRAGRQRSKLGNLKAGIILVFIGIALTLVQQLGTPREAFMGDALMRSATVISFVLGVGFIILHYIVRAYEKKEEEAAKADALQQDVEVPGE
jgi:hypothetical protein